MSLHPDESRTLMVANTLATILIVVLHYNTRTLIDWSGAFGITDVLQEVVVNGVARVAVPLFALMSAFFLAPDVGTLKAYRTALRKRSRSLLIPYFVGASFAYVVGMSLKSLCGIDFPAQWNLHDAAYFVLVQPEPSQYWFLRDLIILTLASPLLLRGPLALSLVLTSVLGLVWVTNTQPFPVVGGWYFLHSETLFFFCLGGVMARFSGLWSRLGGAPVWVVTLAALLWAALVAFRLALEPRIDVWYVEHYSLASVLLYKTTILLAIFLTLVASYRLRHRKTLCALSGLTFFVFLYHMDPLRTIQGVVERVVPHPYAFFVLVPLVLLVTFGSAALLARWAPRFYAVIAGGRSPQKALGRLTP